MKNKTNVNVIISIIAIVVAISSLLCITCNYFVRIQALEEDITSCKTALSAKDEELKKLKGHLKEYDFRESGESRCRQSYGKGTTWLSTDIQQGQKELKDGEDFVLEAGRYTTVAFASNVTIDENNSNPEVERHYKLIDPDKAGYLILDGVETGITIISLYSENKL